MTTIKEKCEAIWNETGVQHSGHSTIWTEKPSSNGRWRGNRHGLRCSQGVECIPTVGKSAERFMRRVRKHWGPPPMAYCGDAKLVMPGWLRENYKRNCPHNYATLIAEYGKGVTKLDRAITRKSFTELAAED